ncbi:hypothetical protein ACFWY6_05400 [Streptomyces sp. NPDC059037]|uniref:hypothetical protein n=1 Tax=Streptomyces sp. NPDC059037 TaxID=3346710 RepID=UPI00369D30FD
MQGLTESVRALLVDHGREGRVLDALPGDENLHHLGGRQDGLGLAVPVEDEQAGEFALSHQPGRRHGVSVDVHRFVNDCQVPCAHHLLLIC